MTMDLNMLARACQYVEQLDKLKQSPQSAATAIPAATVLLGFGGNSGDVLPTSPASVTNGGSARFNGSFTAHNATNNNNNGLRNPRQTGVAGASASAAATAFLHVSSSAPGAGGQFQHLNGLTITPSNGRGGQPRHHSTSQDYEQLCIVAGSPAAAAAVATSGASAAATVVATAGASGTFSVAAVTNGAASSRSSDGRLSEETAAPLALTHHDHNHQHHQQNNHHNSNHLQEQPHQSNFAQQQQESNNSNSIAINQLQQQQQSQQAQQKEVIHPYASAIATHRRKSKATAMPLTPPPMASRKFVDPNGTQQRIRSFSMSSHKLVTANQQLLQQQHQQQQQQPQQMMIDDAEMTCVTPTMPATSTTTSSSLASPSSGSSNHSPPRSGSGSHQYMQLMGVGGHQAANSNGSSSGSVSGRRRTISSNSTGAGTREVHNKLEKNRRAQLKECYKALQQQLQLNDEDRKKTSNLCILIEAHNRVQTMKEEMQKQEIEQDRLASIKMNTQMRIANLKKELAPKFQQMYPNLFKDTDMMFGNIPSECVDATDSSSPSSGRGSTLYSSTSSLASGGSMSSPLGSAMPTATSPVISKTTSSSSMQTTMTPATAANGVPAAASSASLLQYHQPTGSYKMQTTTTTSRSPVGSPTATAMTSTTTTSGNGGGISTTLSPTTTATIINTSSPLSLTAKNISATSLTRGSPTSPSGSSPLTPSPTPSSSSDVSTASSSMLMMTASPPMLINGTITTNGGLGGGGSGGGTRNVTVNIPNGLKFQAASNGIAGGAKISAIGNGAATAAATIIATSPPGNNNAHLQSTQIYNNTTIITTPSTTTTATTLGKVPQGPINDFTNNNNNNINKIPPKTSITTTNSGMPPRSNGFSHHQYEDGEQPTKLIKVLNGAVTAGSGGKHHNHSGAIHGNNNYKSNGLVHSPVHLQNILVNGPVTAQELAGGRLPGGAELNILASSAVQQRNGSGGGGGPAFYHANGKLTLVNSQVSVRNGLVLRDKVMSGGAATAPTSVASGGGLHYAGNFAQFTVASTATSASPKHGSLIAGASDGKAAAESVSKAAKALT